MEMHHTFTRVVLGVITALTDDLTAKRLLLGANQRGFRAQ